MWLHPHTTTKHTHTLVLVLTRRTREKSFKYYERRPARWIIIVLKCHRLSNFFSICIMLWKGCCEISFLLIVGLVCWHFGVVAANNRCPNVCDCYNNQYEQSVWNCSGLSNANMLWQHPDADTLGFDVKHLIIRQSRIDFQENFSHLFPILEILELPSNRLIHCSKSSVWLLEWATKLKDADSILCSSPRPLNGTNLLKALNLIQDVDSQCPKNCTCELSHVPKDDQYGITIHINCTNLGLTELPKVLPANVTIHLHLSGNQVCTIIVMHLLKLLYNFIFLIFRLKILMELLVIPVTVE